MINRIVAVTLVIGISTTGMAKQEECQLDLPYQLSIDNKTVIVKDNDEELLRIDENNRLSLYGNSQHLNPSQQKLVVQMASGYRDLIPEIATIAGEAAEMAVKAVTATVTTLFSDNPDTSAKLMTKLDGLSDRIRREVEQKQLNGGIVSSDGLSDDFDAELDAIVDEVVENASGKTVLKIVSQALSGDEEELKDLEFRMEMFGKDLEAQMEFEAEKLANTAKKLCDQFDQLDGIESQLQLELPAYAKLDLIRPSR